MRTTILGVLFAVLLHHVLATTQSKPLFLNPAVGIDLGTCYTRMATYFDGNMKIFPNPRKDFSHRTRSTVTFTQDNPLVGESRLTPYTMFGMKYLIGQKSGTNRIRTSLKSNAFTIYDRDGWPFIGVPDLKHPQLASRTLYAPEKITSILLKQMKDIASDYYMPASPIQNVVISVPAHFDYVQREATKAAAILAGMTVHRLIDDPVAAVIGAGLTNDKNKNKKVIVIDLGGGSFDVSIVNVDNGRAVLGEIGAVNLKTPRGCDAIDNSIINYILLRFTLNTGLNVYDDATIVSRLIDEAEQAKIELSTYPSTMIKVDRLFRGHDFMDVLDRTTFEGRARYYLNEVLYDIDLILRKNNLEKEQVDDILLIGGCSRIPLARELIKTYFNGKEPLDDISDDEVVVRGAAIAADDGDIWTERLVKPYPPICKNDDDYTVWCLPPNGGTA